MQIVYVICERLLAQCGRREPAVEDAAVGWSYSLAPSLKGRPFHRHFYCSRFDVENTRRLPYQTFPGAARRKRSSKHSDSIYEAHSSAIQTLRGPKKF